jgi:methylated-DNA-[protein]-cysteine S-methyltransferase
MNPFNFTYFSSTLGIVFVISNNKGVSRVIFGRDRFKQYMSNLNGARLSKGSRAEKSAREIELYIAGRLKGFQSELDLSSGTPFQISVWRELLKIPYGNVRTYREIAEKIGNPRAARAVGNAAGANPIPIIIPCHRVIGVNGLGGYSCGIQIKKKLLEIEGVL